jgi:hypothetical protein
LFFSEYWWDKHLNSECDVGNRGTNKRRYGIEMNELREVYLGAYSSVDSVDHLPKNWSCEYRSWKWWHAPM